LAFSIVTGCPTFEEQPASPSSTGARASTARPRSAGAGSSSSSRRASRCGTPACAASWPGTPNR